MNRTFEHVTKGGVKQNVQVFSLGEKFVYVEHRDGELVDKMETTLQSTANDLYEIAVTDMVCREYGLRTND